MNVNWLVSFWEGCLSHSGVVLGLLIGVVIIFIIEGLRHEPPDDK